MRRREVVVLLGCAVARPLAAYAQQRPRRVAVLSPVDSPQTPFLDAFRARLGELGYSEPRDIVLEYRLAGGRVERLPALAEELARDAELGQIDAVVAESTPAALAARSAIRTVPIVALAAVDPVGAGLVASLARPGGNLTGVAILGDELNAKRIELLREALPGARRIGVVASGTAAASLGNVRSIETAGRQLGLDVETLPIADIARLAAGLSPAALARFDGYVVAPDVALVARRRELIEHLNASGRPAVYPSRAWAEAGGLFALGPNLSEAYSRLASQLDRVLKGERPSELPFQRSDKSELVVNLKTASAFALSIPPSLLARADEVIE